MIFGYYINVYVDGLDMHEYEYVHCTAYVYVYMCMAVHKMEVLDIKDL